MKRHTTLAELVNELKDQNMQKKDFVVPANLLSMENGQLVVNNYNADDSLSKLLKEVGIESESDNKLILNCLPILHQNLSDKLDIPRRYYNRIQTLEETQLIDSNVSHWLKNMKGNIFLRTFINN
jgi:hypothetical protein